MKTLLKRFGFALASAAPFAVFGKKWGQSGQTLRAGDGSSKPLRGLSFLTPVPATAPVLVSRVLCGTFALAFIAFGFISPVFGAQYYVTPTSDGTGSCSGTGPFTCTTLRAAISAANASLGIQDAIDLGTGPYTLSAPSTGNENGNVGGDLDIRGDLTINGPVNGTATINGNNLSRVLHVISGDVILNRITITAGSDTSHNFSGYDAWAGGINVVSPSKLTLNQSFVRNNTGTGIFSNHAVLTLNDSEVSGNKGWNSAGGIYNFGGTLFLTRSVVTRNSASGIGGIWAQGPTTLTDSTVSYNKATGNAAGGILNYCATSTLIRSTVSNNSAQTYGGGIRNYGNCAAPGELRLINSTVSGNTAVNDGGGIWNECGLRQPCTSKIAIILSNSTVTGNTAGFNNSAGRGGGISNLVGTVKLKNSIVAGNNATANKNCSGTISSLGYNISDDGSCNLDPSKDLPTAFPALLNLGTLGLHPPAGPTATVELLLPSIAIDIIPSLDCYDAHGNQLSTDQRGVLRPQPPGGGGRCDIGAFEAFAPAPKTTYNAVADFSGTAAGNSQTSRWSYRYNTTGARSTASYTLLPNYAQNTSVYQWRDGATVVPTRFWSRALTITGKAVNELPEIGANQTGKDLTMWNLRWPKDYLFMHPDQGQGLTVLSFLVPNSGQADVAFTFEYLSNSCSPDGVRWYVDHYVDNTPADNPLYQGLLRPPMGTAQSQTFAINVTGGDRLNFMIDSGANGNHCADWVGAKVEIKI